MSYLPLTGEISFRVLKEGCQTIFLTPYKILLNFSWNTDSSSLLRRNLCSLGMRMQGGHEDWSARAISRVKRRASKFPSQRPEA